MDDYEELSRLLSAARRELGVAAEIIRQFERDKVDRQRKVQQGLVPPEYLLDNIAVNVDNKKLSDAEFRAYVRRSLPLRLS